VNPAFGPGACCREEEAAYDRLSARDRVRVLRALCELRNDVSNISDLSRTSMSIELDHDSSIVLDVSRND
jgi:hypothetical protein